MARKRGMQYIPYDYEAAYNKAMEDMHEWFIENLFQHRKKVIYQIQIEELEEIIKNSICQNKDKRRGKKESGAALYDIKGLHSGYCRFAHIKSTGCD